MAKNICVYCGASQSIIDVYKLAAAELGGLIAKNGHRLVYGGGRNGLMGIVADSVIQSGGEVIGFVPAFLDEREGAHPNLTELHIVDSMHTRKSRMADTADMFCILPGGFGTLDELFEIITWKQLSIHQKPIVILNIDGYWDPLVKLIERVFDYGFAQPVQTSYICVVDKVEQIIGVTEEIEQIQSILEQ